MRRSSTLPDVSTLTDERKPAKRLSGLNLGMSTLVERLHEVMEAMHWSHADLVEVSKQSSSVVSQWLGNGSKVIKTIGKLEAAIYIERASGFSALWVAKGLGSKRVGASAQKGTSALLRVEEPAGAYLTLAQMLDYLGGFLGKVPTSHRKAVADNLSGWAMDGGAAHWQAALASLLQASGKQPARA